MTPVKSVRTLQFRGQNRQKEGNTLWFVPYAFVFFSKYARWLYVPSEGHIITRGYILLKNEQTVPKLASRATFATAKSLYWF